MTATRPVPANVRRLVGAAIIATAILAPASPAGADAWPACIQADVATDFTWVYRNAPAATGNGHVTPLGIAITDDPWTRPVYAASYSLAAFEKHEVAIHDAPLILTSGEVVVVADATVASRAEVLLTWSTVSTKMAALYVVGPGGSGFAMVDAASAAQTCANVNVLTATTGVEAVCLSATAQLSIRSVEYGADQFVRVIPFERSGIEMNPIADWGSDALVTAIAGSAAGVTVDGLNVSVDRVDLRADFRFVPDFAGSTTVYVSRLDGSGVPQSHTTTVARGGPEAFEFLDVDPKVFSQITLENAVFDGPEKVIGFSIDATTAERAHVDLSEANVPLVNGAVLIEGNKGSAQCAFTAPATAAGVMAVINAVSDQTGVVAVANPYGGGGVRFQSALFGSSQFVRITRLNGAVFPVDSDYDQGADATVTSVDGRSTGFEVDGLHVTVDRPELVMEFDIASDAVVGASFYATVRRVDDGAVVIEATADPLVWNILGGRVGASAVGPVLLNVAVTNHPGEQTLVRQVLVNVRPLGDVNGDGNVTTADGIELGQRLNGIPVAGRTLRDFDLDANGAVTNADRVLLTKVLNGLAID